MAITVPLCERGTIRWSWRLWVPGTLITKVQPGRRSGQEHYHTPLGFLLSTFIIRSDYSCKTRYIPWFVSGYYRCKKRFKVKIGGKFLAFKTKGSYSFNSLCMYFLVILMFVLMVWTLGILWFSCFKGLVSDTNIGIPDREREKQKLHLC